MSNRLRVDQYPAHIQNQIALQLHGKLSDNHTPVASRVCNPEPKQIKCGSLLGDHKKKQSGEVRTCVVITRCSSSRLDRDNAWASTKSLVDALRNAGQITGDTEDDIELFVFQAKVPRKESGTLIEIVRLQ